MGQETTSKTSLKLKALKEVSKSVNYLDMLDMLKTDLVLTQQECDDIKKEYDPIEHIFIALEKAYKNNKIDLLTYDWTLLPRSQVKITIVSPGAMREWIHE
jgi:hypothetical protein